VRRKPLVSGLRTHPVNRLNADHWPAASKHRKHSAAPGSAYSHPGACGRIFALRKWLRASGTQVSETRAKLNLNTPKKEKKNEKRKTSHPVK